MRGSPSRHRGDHDDANDTDNRHNDDATNPDQIIAAESQPRRRLRDQVLTDQIIAAESQHGHGLRDQVMSGHVVASEVLVSATSPRTAMTRPCHRSLSENAARTAPIVAMARASKNQAGSSHVSVTVASVRAVASPDVATTVSGALLWSTNNPAEPAPAAVSRHTSAVLMSAGTPAPEA